ncbi:MAG: hypothetical protein OXF01_13055 [Gemmatimonadetes bacterium]|nr:hypothetical protein [Gemmatimonadota bacterium]
MKRAYGLTVDRRERDTLARTLAGCADTDIDMTPRGTVAAASPPASRGKKLTFPVYTPSGMTTTRCPDPDATRAIEALNAAYELTKNEETRQCRDGRCAVRDTWDEAVAQALGIDVETIFEYAELLASEPAVSATRWARTLTGLYGENHS